MLTLSEPLRRPIGKLGFHILPNCAANLSCDVWKEEKVTFIVLNITKNWEYFVTFPIKFQMCKDWAQGLKRCRCCWKEREEGKERTSHCISWFLPLSKLVCVEVSQTLISSVLCQVYKYHGPCGSLASEFALELLYPSIHQRRFPAVGAYWIDYCLGPFITMIGQHSVHAKFPTTEISPLSILLKVCY